MKINLTELIEGQKKEFDLKMEEEIDPIVYRGDTISFVAPVSFLGSIYMVNNEIYIQGKSEWTAEFQCHRCLKKFVKSILVDVNERLTQEDTAEFEEDDCFVIRNNQIDISKIMENLFVLSLPMKTLCDPNCKGLCSVCGANLNVEQCDCKSEAIDPRLAQLKDLLQ